MDTEFFDAVLPATGVRQLIVFHNGLRAAPAHYPHTDNAALAEGAERCDRKGLNVYYGCATYKTGDSRKQENVEAVKSLWADLDCGEGKPYPRKKDAADDLKRAVAAIGLPTPWVDDSGGGLHLYLPFVAQISPEAWDGMAARFAACLDHVGLKHDTSCTTDKSRILRVPGTHNFKFDPPRPVTLKVRGAITPAVDLNAILQRYIDTHGLLVNDLPKSRAPKAPAMTNDLIGNVKHPDSYGAGVVAGCQVIRSLDETGGDAPYPIWWAAMGVAKHLKDGDEYAERWSANRKATGHEKYDPHLGMHSWNTGPAFCSNFQKEATCTGCPHAEKEKFSPIFLGVPALPESATEEEIAAHAAAIEALAKPIVTKFRTDEMLAGMSAKHGMSVNTRGEIVVRRKDDDGNYQDVPWCNRYWQVMARLRQPDKTTFFDIAVQSYPETPPEHFVLPSKVVGSPEMRQFFASKEIYFTGPRHMDHANALLQYQQSLLFTAREETPLFPTWGWVREENKVAGALTGEFVLGEKIYRPAPQGTKSEPLPAKMTPDTSPQQIAAFTSKGTSEAWVDLIDKVYNRPGAEAYQFVVLSAFAAPLVKLMPTGGDWHGIPIVLHGDSGGAKSTTAYIAMSVYGRPQGLKINMAASNGDSMSAMSIKAGAMCNLPIHIDEFTGHTPEVAAQLMYMFANGRGRDIATRDRKLQDNFLHWSTITLVTSNDDLHDVVTGTRNTEIAKAAQVRCFEVPMSEEDMKNIFAGVSRDTIEHEILFEQYGTVGPRWIQFLVNNREQISQLLGDERRAYKIGENDSSKVRFYKDLLVTMKVAGKLAKAKGFIRWDVNKMILWAENTLRGLNATVMLDEWDNRFSAFLGSLNNRTIITKHIQLTPGRRHSDEPVLNDKILGAPAARHALEDRKFFVTMNAVKDWCKENKITAKEFVSKMAQKGAIATTPEYDPKRKNVSELCRRMNIANSTAIVSGQCPCLELDYASVTGKVLMDAPDNVIELSSAKSVTQDVTDPPSEEATSS
jgi:Domain of unknown function (DUF927)